MPESANNEPVITEAARHFVSSIRLPEIARLMNSRSEDLDAASQALRKLTQAAEELNDPVTDAWSLGRRFPALLAEHQTTWRSAFRIRVEGHFVESVCDTFSDIWQTVFLPVLLDRSTRAAGVVEFSDFDWIRIFGKPRQESKSWIVFCADGQVSTQIELRAPMDSPLMIPMWLMAVQSDASLRVLAGEHLATVPRAERARRHVYDYSPIGDQDLSVSIEAMRDTAGSVDYMRNLMLASVVFFTDKDVLSHDSVYKILDENGISTRTFHRALNPIYSVTLPSLEMARARHRRAEQQGQAESQPVRVKKNTAGRGKRTRPTAKKRRSARREVTTP